MASGIVLGIGSSSLITLVVSQIVSPGRPAGPAVDGRDGGRWAAGWTNAAIARKLGLVANAAGKWRKRFVAEGLDGPTPIPKEGT